MLHLRPRLHAYKLHLQPCRSSRLYFISYLLKPGFHSNARNARNASTATHASHATHATFSCKDRLRQFYSVAWLALAYRLLFVFCLRNFLAFVAFLAHFLFFLRTFSYTRPCVRCILDAFEWKPCYASLVITAHRLWNWHTESRNFCNFY